MTVSIQLHLLNATGRLTPFAKEIEFSFQDALKRICSLLPIDNVDVCVNDNIFSVIRGFGIGGHIHGANFLTISFDPSNEKIHEIINNDFKRTLAHELYHCIRSQHLKTERNLLSALISEGLTQQFTIEVWGKPIEPWAIALDEEKLSFFMKKAKKDFYKTNINYNDWFFGTNKNIPRWTGYSIGFKLVGDYLKKNPNKKPSTLYSTPPKQFI